MKYVGKYSMDKTIDVYEIEGKLIALNKWNGENYYKCFELDKNLTDIIDCNITAIPVYKKLDNGSYKIINYKIIKED